jgi:2-keto-4-pentenoate hydratase/2-oxohepta-3-ene-1,7-dioic acid hydratase in catechol pathway
MLHWVHLSFAPLLHLHLRSIMKLITFDHGGHVRVGALRSSGAEVLDLCEADPSLPQGMCDLIRAGPETWSRAREAAASGARGVPLGAVRLLAPIPRPAKNVLCVGKNFRAHAKEFRDSGYDGSATEGVPAVPVVFTKASTSVVGPGAPIPASLDPTRSTDYEGELAVVIGLPGRRIPRERAFEHVFGYTLVNDVTARTIQHRHRQWFLGKSVDGFCPMGPAIVTADEVPDVGALRLITRVNDEVRQQASLADLIFDIPTLIETISGLMTLEAGDIIATGTPAGVGIGFTPPRFLQKGDRVSIALEPIGELENPVH